MIDNLLRSPWLSLFAAIIFMLGCGSGVVLAGSALAGINAWQTLISVIVGSTVALIVAAFQRQSVHLQIESQRRISSRADDDAYTAIREGARELYGMLNLLWRAVDVVLAQDRQEYRKQNAALVFSMIRALPDEKNIDALVEIADQMNRQRRRKFLLFINMVRSLYRNARDDVDSEGDEEQRKWFFLGLRTYLTHAHVYLTSFVSDSASLFKDRTKSRVDHRDMHEHLEGSVAIAEQGKNWLQ